MSLPWNRYWHIVTEMEQDEIQDQNHSSCISGADVYDRDALPCLSQIENTIKQIT